MSASQPARCLLSKASAPSKVLSRLPQSQRYFHSSPSCLARRKPKNQSIKAEDMGVGEKAKREKNRKIALAKEHIFQAREALFEYTPKEIEELREKYTPEQMESILAAEESISLDDVANQGKIRRDAFALDYLDDFSTIRAVVDKQPRIPEKDIDPKKRFKTDDEILDEIDDFIMGLPDETRKMSIVDIQKFYNEFDTQISATQKEPYSAMAPPIPLMDRDDGSSIVQDIIVQEGQAGKSESGVGDEDGGIKDRARLDKDRKLMLQTGYSGGEISRLSLRRLIYKRVVNQTRMGKIPSLYTMYVCGNENGMVGIGEGKAFEVDDSMRISEMRSIRNMVPIHRYEDRTIYGDVEGKCGAVTVKLFNRPPGFGLRCQFYIYEICKAAGFSDIAARVDGARNPMNVAKATMIALQKQRLPDEIARGRGKKLIDVRKVYYGGVDNERFGQGRKTERSEG